MASRGILSWCGALALGHVCSVVVTPNPLEHRLNSRGIWAWLLCGMWDLTKSGTEPVSLALAGGFFTTDPPGQPCPLSFE